MELSDLERDFVQNIQAHGKFSCSSCKRGSRDPGRSLRSEVVRAAILGLPIAGIPTVGRPPGQISIEEATIVGDLDLSDTLVGDGEAVALIFKCCRLDRIYLANGRFGRFSLEGCRIIELDGRGARFEGAVDLSGVASAEPEAGGTGCRGCAEKPHEIAGRCCSVNLSRAVIKGELRARGARLCAPPRDDALDISSGDTPYALMLVGADIGGQVLLQPEFVAVGGVSLGAAVVRGSVWLQGATLIAEWADALNLGQAHIEQSVALSGLFRRGHAPSAFEADGTIRLYGAVVDGELYMEGARIRARENEAAIIGFMSTIRKVVRLSVLDDPNEQHSSIPPIIQGPITFDSASLGGFTASGADLDGRGTSALDFTGARIEGDLTLYSQTGKERADRNQRFEQAEQPAPAFDNQSRNRFRKTMHRTLCRGSITATDAIITGRVSLHGVSIEAKLNAIEARGIRVGNQVQIGSCTVEHQLHVDAPIKDKSISSSLKGGAADFSFARLDGGANISPHVIGNGSSSLILRAATISGEIRLRCRDAKGKVDFESATITKDVHIKNVTMRCDGLFSLDY